MSDLASLLMQLSDIPGPSGFEHEVRKRMKMELTPYADKFKTDGMGSLIAERVGPKGAPKVMMSAHMDEVGLMVRYVTSDGYVKIQTLGGWLDQALIGQKWQILTSIGTVIGISGIKTPHVMSSEEKNRITKKDQIFLDVGASSKQEAEETLGIKPGDPIAPYTKSESLNKNHVLVGKAWDDRAGLAVMIGTLSKLKDITLPCTLYSVSSVQEEVGLRGAHTSSYSVSPDIGINLESGVAGDYPGITQDEAQERLGKGPAIFLHDSSMIPNTKFRDFAVNTAEEIGINLQYNVLSGYGQDGAEMQKTNSGCPVINITVPTRYLHSHNSVIDLNDVVDAIELTTALIKKLDQKTVSSIQTFE